VNDYYDNKMIALTCQKWDVSQIKFLKPRANESGKGKNLSIMSSQLNSHIRITTPFLRTYGIADYMDPKTGISDNKYSISLAFPSQESATEDTDLFLDKLKKFEEAILDQAVISSATWWGKPMSRELLSHTFTSSLKYPKVQGTSNADYSRPPTMRAKIYQGQQSKKWDVEIYNQNKELIFPEEGSDDAHPEQYIPKNASVACMLQGGGLWFAATGWGVTWKCVQILVKTPENMAFVSAGTCFIDVDVGDNTSVSATTSAPVPLVVSQFQSVKKEEDVVNGVIVADSDDEQESPPSIEEKDSYVDEENPDPVPLTGVSEDKKRPLEDISDTEKPVVIKKKKTTVVKVKPAAIA
jgi:hypothetical protein